MDGRSVQSTALARSPFERVSSPGHQYEVVPPAREQFRQFQPEPPGGPRDQGRRGCVVGRPFRHARLLSWDSIQGEGEPSLVWDDIIGVKKVPYRMKIHGYGGFRDSSADPGRGLGGDRADPRPRLREVSGRAPLPDAGDPAGTRVAGGVYPRGPLPRARDRDRRGAPLRPAEN